MPDKTKLNSVQDGNFDTLLFMINTLINLVEQIHEMLFYNYFNIIKSIQFFHYLIFCISYSASVSLDLVQLQILSNLHKSLAHVLYVKSSRET